jgi:hypothetical protein
MNLTAWSAHNESTMAARMTRKCIKLNEHACTHLGCLRAMSIRANNKVFLSLFHHGRAQVITVLLVQNAVKTLLSILSTHQDRTRSNKTGRYRPCIANTISGLILLAIRTPSLIFCRILSIT